MMAGEGESMQLKQTHKAAVHYTVGRICEEVSKQPSFNLTFSRQVIAALAEVTHRQLTLYAGDLEAYAGHAKRSAINRDDVMLLVRRNKHLAGHIGELVEKMEKEGTLVKKKGRKRKKPAEEEGEEEEEEEEKKKEKTDP